MSAPEDRACSRPGALAALHVWRLAHVEEAAVQLRAFRQLLRPARQRAPPLAVFLFLLPLATRGRVTGSAICAGVTPAGLLRDRVAVPLRHFMDDVVVGLSGGRCRSAGRCCETPAEPHGGGRLVGRSAPPLQPADRDGGIGDVLGDGCRGIEGVDCAAAVLQQPRALSPERTEA